jgi:hypothetical protein
MARIKPLVHAAVREPEAVEGLTYVYRVQNRHGAEQALQRFAIETPTDAVLEPIAVPAKWFAIGRMDGSGPFHSWGSAEEPYGFEAGDRGSLGEGRATDVPAGQCP